MTDKKPLTLERLAALDEAATDLGLVAFPPHGILSNEEVATREQGIKFLIAIKGAAPRLLAALRGLAVEWVVHREALTAEDCADELRAVIATLDLSQLPPAPQEESK